MTRTTHTPDEPLSLTHFCNLVGEFIHYWGFKKIHGQVWTYIYLHPEPMCVTSLSRKLKVSKASVSLALKDLLKFEVIRHASRHGRRTTYFESNNQLLQVITGVLRNRECLMLEKVLTEYASMKEIIAVNPEHCQEKNFVALGEMIGTAKEFLHILVNSNLEIQHLMTLDRTVHSVLDKLT